MVRAVSSVSLVTALVLGILTWSAELVPVSANEPFQFVNFKTYKCLDIADDGKVVSSSCNTTWVADGTHFKTTGSGECLEMSPNKDVYTGPCDFNNKFQGWKTHRTLLKLVNDGTGLCVDSTLRGVGCKLYSSKEQIWLHA